MRKIILHNRFTLLATIALGSFLLIMLEGRLTDRESSLFGISNPLFEIKINR